MPSQPTTKQRNVKRVNGQAAAWFFHQTTISPVYLLMPTQRNHKTTKHKKGVNGPATRQSPTHKTTTTSPSHATPPHLKPHPPAHTTSSPQATSPAVHTTSPSTPHPTPSSPLLNPSPQPLTALHIRPPSPSHQPACSCNPCLGDRTTTSRCNREGGRGPSPQTLSHTKVTPAGIPSWGLK